MVKRHTADNAARRRIGATWPPSTIRRF